VLGLITVLTIEERPLRGPTVEAPEQPAAPERIAAE